MARVDNIAHRPIDLLCLGETMGLVSSDKPGALMPGSFASVSFGGAESNVAIAAARLGASTAWVSRVGDDPFGDMIVRTLRSEGVATYVTVDPERPTGIMAKTRPGPVRQRVTYWRAGSAASAMSTPLIDSDLLASARMLVVTGVTAALSPTLPGDLRELMVRARSLGTRVAFDLNMRPALWGAAQARETFADMAPHADIVLAGVDDAQAIGLDAHDVPSTLAVIQDAYGCAVSVVTDGARGAGALVDGRQYARAAHPVAVVDSVGAGDCFTGAFLAEWVRGCPIETCLDTAVVAGSHACLVAGDWEGAPTRPDLAALASGPLVER